MCPRESPPTPWDEAFRRLAVYIDDVLIMVPFNDPQTKVTLAVTWLARDNQLVPSMVPELRRLYAGVAAAGYPEKPGGPTHEEFLAKLSSIIDALQAIPDGQAPPPPPSEAS